MTGDINKPLISHCFLFTMALKGWSQLLTRSNGERAKNSKGAHLGLLRQRQNMKGKDSTVQGKKNIHEHKYKSCNLKKHKKTNSWPNRAVWTVFVNRANWRGSMLAIYKTVQIIFPLRVNVTRISNRQSHTKLSVCTRHAAHAKRQKSKREAQTDLVQKSG